MSLIIPFGSACRVRQAIENYKGHTGVTHLFDWNLTNFATILYCVKNINIPFVEDEWYDLNEICTTNTRVVAHKEYKFKSAHDFPTHKTYQEYMPIFLEKYNRRKKRLKKLFMNTNVIHLIHFLATDFGDIDRPDPTQVVELYHAIKNINPNHKIHLHILIRPDQEKDEVFDRLAVNKYVHIHYMKRIGEYVENEHFGGANWNWCEIFDNL